MLTMACDCFSFTFTLFLIYELGVLLHLMYILLWITYLFSVATCNLFFVYCISVIDIVFFCGGGVSNFAVLYLCKVH